MGGARGFAAQRKAASECAPGQVLVDRCAQVASLPAQSPRRLAAEPNCVSRAALGAPNDPAYHELIGEVHVQWAAHALDAVTAWARYPGRYFQAADRPQEAPIVALIDTGVDSLHPDFMNVGARSAEVAEGGQLLLSSARTFLSEDDASSAGGAADEHGHGTHLAGVIAAGTDNGVTLGSGIAGLGYPVRLLPVKVAGANGVARHADIARGIVYGADQGAAVILIGFTGPTWSQTLQEAVDYAWDRGCFLVAAGGDSGPGQSVFPAACPHVFGVAAITSGGALAPYSGSGDHVALAAPGGDDAMGVYSTLPTYACTLRQDLTEPPYGWLFGSSEAAAHVAAAAALYAGSAGLVPNTGHEGAVIWQMLQQSARSLGEAGPAEWRPECGYGALALSVLLAEDATSEEGLGSIVGRVLLAGEPAAEASVTGAAEEGGPAATVSTVGPAGRYRIPNLSPGVYRVTGQAQGISAEWDKVTVLPGCDSPGIDLRLGDPAVDAALVASDMPEAAVRGETVELHLTFANTGEGSWRRAEGHCLKQIEGQSPLSPIPDQVELAPAETIAPGEERSFRVSLPVPDRCGFYDTAWQMCQQGGGGHFGAIAEGTISVTSFLDVPADHWAVGEIEAAKEAGFVSGYEGNLYRPEWSVSRDQMAVYLARALAGGDQGVPPGPDSPTFNDVDTDHWAYRYIECVYAQGVVQGYGDRSYHPEYLLDRAQLSVFMARALAGGADELADYVPPETPTFADVGTDSWAYGSVEYLQAGGVVSGYPDDLYHPEYICSRDQIAVYLARGFDLPVSEPAATECSRVLAG